jgi:hypothetical protein
VQLDSEILVLAFLVYIAWPWFWQGKPWEDLTSWLQQIRLPQLQIQLSCLRRFSFLKPGRTISSKTHKEFAFAHFGKTRRNGPHADCVPEKN